MQTPTAAEIDHVVDVALREWEVAGQLEELDPLFVESFLTDWPVVEDRLSRLQRWERFMSPAQREKYAQVLRLKTAYRRHVESQLLAHRH